MNMNLDITAIDTDRQLADILNNFSQDYIEDLINQAFMWKFRPFENRMPNYAYLFEQKYQGIIDNYTGGNDELILNDRYDTYKMIIDIICRNYNLVVTDDINPEQIYSLCYILCQLLLTDFTDKLIDLFAQYISTHVEDLIASLPEEKRNYKSSFSKKVEADPKHICIYENMPDIVNMVASLDIPFYQLLVMISDEKTADFITSYIDDLGDIYKNYFVYYIYEPSTRSKVITSIKLKFVSMTYANMNILNMEAAQFYN